MERDPRFDAGKEKLKARMKSNSDIKLCGIYYTAAVAWDVSFSHRAVRVTVCRLTVRKRRRHIMNALTV